MNQNQRIFAVAIARGASGEKAYKEAGYKSEGNAARASASALLKKPDIKSEIERLQNKAESKSILTAIQLKEAITRMMAKAEAKEDFSGFSQLTDRLCKMSGFYEPTKIETDTEISIVIGGEDD